MSNFEYNHLLAALIVLRFGGHAEGIEAWKRMLQNSGWDETPEGREQWWDMVEKGLRDLRELGIKE